MLLLAGITTVVAGIMQNSGNVVIPTALHCRSSAVVLQLAW